MCTIVYAVVLLRALGHCIFDSGRLNAYYLAPIDQLVFNDVHSLDMFRFLSRHQLYIEYIYYNLRFKICDQSSK